MKMAEEAIVGLCFSFPVEHHSIKSGSLIKWTKGFKNEGAVGSDPTLMLCNAFKRQAPPPPSLCQHTHVSFCDSYR